MYRYLTVVEAAERTGLKPRRVRQKCEHGDYPGARKNRRGEWEVPEAADARLAQAYAPQQTGEAVTLDGVGPERRDEALRKLGLVRRCWEFADDYVRTGGRHSEGMAVFASRHGLDRATLYRWKSKYRLQGLAGLLDTRGRPAVDAEPISPEAFELFKSMYLSPQQLSVKLCWQNVNYVNTSEKRGWTIPPYKRLVEYVNANIPCPFAVLHREGLSAYKAKCAPYIQRDADSIEPGEIWCGDHHQFNILLRHRGDWLRPWITAWEDMRSRLIVGWHISAGPNQATILRAMKRGVEKYGPPEGAKIDNGRDYDSQMWTGVTKKQRRALRKGYLDEELWAGVYGMMGVTVSFALPYHAQSKPLERFFDTLDCRFCKTVPTYCGKDSGRKPEDLAAYLESKEGLADAYDLESFAELVGRYIEAYNNSPHSGVGMDGRTPAEVFSTRTRQRVLLDGALELLCMVWSKEQTIGRNGVRLKGVYYGQYDMELFTHQNKRVRVAYDPDDLRRVYVYDARTLRLLAVAEQNQLMQYGKAVAEEDLREAMRQQRHAAKVARQFRDSRLAANMDLTSLTLRAMEDAAAKRRAEIAGEHREGPIIHRPVRTPLDAQAREAERQKARKQLKRAVGAETVTESLDIDWSLLEKPKREKLKFDWPWERT